MHPPTKPWCLTVLGALSVFVLWASASLSIAADKPGVTMAPGVPSVAGSPLTLQKDAETTSPGIPLTHQMPSSGTATGEEQPAATCRPFKIETPTTLPAGTVTRPFNVTIQASGGVPPVSFALMKGAVLPPGLELNSRGRISGTPLVSGGYRFGILSYDRCPAGVQAEENHFSLMIHNAVSATLPNGNEAVYRPIPVGDEPALHVTGVHLFFENQGASIVVEKDATLPKLLHKSGLKAKGFSVAIGKLTMRMCGPLSAALGHLWRRLPFLSRLACRHRSPAVMIFGLSLPTPVATCRTAEPAIGFWVGRDVAMIRSTARSS